MLRTFVAVVDGGGFSRAAERLHSTQSTVSQQLKRLEVRLDTPLLVRNTRNLTLTERGELLLGYARRMLALNDETLGALAKTRLQGRVRLGSAQEVADGGLAELLGHFSRLHPDVALEIRVDANLKLRQAVTQGELDLAVIFQEPGEPTNGVRAEVIDQLRRVWVSSPAFNLANDQPVPLILANGPCIFRNAVLGSLDAIGRSWRIVLATPSLAGMRAAMRAGLGVGVRTERWLESDLKVFDDEFPPLPDVELVLLSATSTGEQVVEQLRSALLSALDP
ncbi:MAG: LysR substrate-binding domain-containing protein [Candidatus Thiodiazotropha sp.]